MKKRIVEEQVVAGKVVEVVVAGGFGNTCKGQKAKENEKEKKNKKTNEKIIRSF